MPRESKASKTERAGEIVRRLRKEYPGATCALVHSNPLELLVATILSAQCTDRKVNEVTPELFDTYKSARDFAETDPSDLAERIRPTGFYRNKARSIVGAARRIVDEHDGEVPDTMEELTALPGVARKTANVVLGTAFGKNEGVVVDTHVTRLAGRLKLTARKKGQAGKIEQDLMKILPREDWTEFSHLLIFHGRAVCTARKPDCAGCAIHDLCPSAFKIK